MFLTKRFLTRSVLFSRARMRPGKPIQRKFKSDISIGEKGYSKGRMTKMTARIEAKTVLERKRAAERSRLLILRRPSAIILGTAAKSELRRTSFAERRAASEPSPIAIETSASFMAKISLTPSPVIATVLPCAFRALIRDFFSEGVTRVKSS